MHVRRGRHERAPVDTSVESRYARIMVDGGDEPPDSKERRLSERYPVTWSIDCETEDTFLYASITNISEMGIFVRTTDPLSLGTLVTLRFAPSRSSEPFVLRGAVQWINPLRPFHDNPNPGMGIRFIDLLPDERERLVEAIHTIAYVRDDAASASN